MKNKLSLDNILLLLILFVAAILRFWNFANIPFMHDELSALARTHYSTFAEELYYGVKLDGHPAFVQLFLFYFTKLFGENEMAVKFPFIICGLLSIIVAFKVTKFWFNSSVALIVASFMAVMQYFITYSQIARPYITGVLFSLLMVWYWSNYFFNTDKSVKQKYLIGYILSSVFCAYNHHIALLFAIIVCLTGLFFIDKQTWKGYLVAALSVFILYSPHLTIFFYQLHKGGVGGQDGWLGKPDSGWLLNFIKYTFHYSYLMYALCIAVFGLSIYFYTEEIKAKQKFRIIAFVWFFGMFFVQYYYSIYINPILQFSTLIFVFPFILMFLFSFIGELNNILKISIVGSILIIATLTLIVTRKHYQVFYHQPYQEQITNTYKLIDEIGGDKKATIELLIPPLFKEHYFKKYNREFNFKFYNAFDGKADTKAFKKFVNEQTTDYFIFGCLPLEFIQIIKERYPYIIKKEEGFTYSYYCFAKQKPDKELHEQLLFSKKRDSFSLDSTSEYSNNYTQKLKKIIGNRHSIINISAAITSADTAANPSLVMDIQENGKSLNWFGNDYNNFNNYPKTSNTIYLSRDLTDFDFKKHPEAELKIYVWNRNKKNITVDNFNIEIIRGNPFIYALFEPID